MAATDLRDPFQRRLDAFSQELDGVERGDEKALHRARVASRRLRELLPVLKLDYGVRRRLVRRLRKVTRQLGTVRELDVMLRLIGELAEDGRYPRRALRELGARAAQARTKARRRLAVKLPKAKLERLARKLERAAEDLESGAPAQGRRRDTLHRKRGVVWALEARLVRRAGRARAAIEGGGAAYAPGHLHDVRIAVKKLRYAAEVVGEATGKRIAADLAALATAQDVLGRLHDLEVLLALARDAQARLSPPDLTTWRDLASLGHIVESDCRQLHARFMRDRDSLMAIANRLGAGTQETAARVSNRAAG
jgi:CHAD domain-containing protein